MNLRGKACITCRLSTDRPETVKDAKSNILVPPVDSKFMADMVSQIVSNSSLIRKMEKSKKIYGDNVGHKVISTVLNLMQEGRRPFMWAHEELGLWKEESKGVDYL